MAESGLNPKSARGMSGLVALPVWGAVSWAALALALGVVMVVAPAGSAGRSVAIVGVAWAAQALAGGALFVALSRRGWAVQRLPWALFSVGVAARLVADAAWLGARAFGTSPPAVIQVAAYSASYVLLFASLLWLMSTLRKEMVSVATLDAVSVMLTSGLLIFFFALDSGVGLAGDDGLTVLSRLARPVADLGLLFLGLAALLSVRRPPFVVVTNGGLVLLIAADAAYLWTRGDYGLGPAEALWAGGVMMLAFAALLWGGEDVLPARHVGHPGVMLFWFGPLSPLVQYGFLLVWGTLYPPLPPYVLLGGAALAAVLACSMFEINRALERQARKQEELARQAESNRILRELHDTVKQGVHGTSLMLEAATLAGKTGDEAAVRDLVSRALETTRETGHQLSKPLDELRLLSGHAGDAEEFFGENLRSFGERFGMRTRADLAASPGELPREKLSVAHRVFVEAAWNAAKHSGAENLLLQTRREGDDFVLRLSDDGRGFDPGRKTGGYGMISMISRAEEAGARLEIVSEPGNGTTVELRFGR